jgi:hypothetical protein
VYKKLSLFAIPLTIDENERLLRIPIPDVMQRVLEVPLHLPRLGIKRQHRVRVQVVANTVVAIQIRTRVAGLPVNQI